MSEYAKAVMQKDIATKSFFRRMLDKDNFAHFNLFKQKRSRQRKSMIIIGAGLGGLSTGCYAQMNGYDSTIVEMHEIPGGCCTSWERRDFIFDICISWLLGSGSGNRMNRIWNELGALDGKQVRHFDVFNRVYNTDGRYVDFYSDPDKLQAHLLELSPQDQQPIEEFCADLREFLNLTDAHPFLKPMGLMNPWEKIKMLTPYLLRLKLVGKSHSTLISDFCQRFKSPLLREAFPLILYENHPSFPLLPFYFNMACAAQRNAGVPDGGSLGLARSIEQRYRSLGGNVQYNARVEKILIENGRAIGVRLSDGREIKKDIVVSACDGPTVMKQLLNDNYSDPRFDSLYNELLHNPSMTFPSYFTLFLGLNCDYPEHSHCASYVLPQELIDKLPGMLHPSINVQVRNRHYPHIAPPGKAVLFISYFCDYNAWQTLCPTDNTQSRSTKRHTKRRRTVEYRQAKKTATQCLIDFLSQHFSDLRQHIEYTDAATPLTQQRYTGNHKGSLLAWQPFLASGELIEKAVNKQGPRLNGLKNFYMSGHWTTTGGLIRAASSGRHVIQYICRDDGKKFRTFTSAESAEQAGYSTFSSQENYPA